MKNSQIPEHFKILQNLSISRSFSDKLSFSFLWIFNLIKKNKSKRIFAAQNHVNIVVSFACMLAGQTNKLILSERAYTKIAVDRNKYWIRSFIQDKLITFTYKQASLIHCVSRDVKFGLVKYYKISPKKIITIPNIIDIEENNRLANLKSLKLDKKYILFIGRLHNQKNIQMLIDAYLRLDRKHKVSLLIIGEGSEKEKIRKIIHEKNLEDHIRMLGYIENPFPYIKNSSLLALSSDYEGMPNVLLEAISLGVPIVSTNCHSGPYEVVVDNFYGSLSNVGDVKGFTRNMENSLLQQDKRYKCNINPSYSMKSVISRFSKLLFDDRN